MMYSMMWYTELTREFLFSKCCMISRYTHTKSVVFSVPILRNSQILNALHADLLYQIPTKTDKKCGKCSQKFIYTFNPSATEDI